MEEGNLQHKHSTCVWKKNIFFEQTRLSLVSQKHHYLCTVLLPKRKEKKKKPRARDRGKRKKAFQPENKCSRASGAFAGGGGLGAVGKAGVLGCLPHPGPRGLV